MQTTLLLWSELCVCDTRELLEVTSKITFWFERYDSAIFTFGSWSKGKADKSDEKFLRSDFN